MSTITYVIWGVVFTFIDIHRYPRGLISVKLKKQRLEKLFEKLDQRQ